MADKKVRKYAEGERTAADIAGRRSVRVTPKAMPKATVVTPKAMPTPKTTTLVRPKPKPSPKPVPQVQPRPVTVTPKATVVTPKAMPKATVVTPKAMPTPKTTTLVRPKPKPSPRQEPVDETDYFRGQIRRNLRNNPLPKIGNDLVKFKKGGKIRGYGIARGGKPCKMR